MIQVERMRRAGATLIVAALAAVVQAELPSDWKSLDPKGLADVAGRLKGPGAAADRKLLADHVTTTYFDSGPEALRTRYFADWTPLVVALDKELDQGVRKRWATALREAFAADAKTLVRMKPDDVPRFIDLIRKLEGAGPAAGLAAEVVEQTDTWRSWPVEPMVALGDMLAGDKDRGQARRTVAGEFFKQGLSTPDVAAKLPPALHRRAAACFASDLTEGQRAAWAEQLIALRMGRGEAVARASAGTAISVLDCLDAIGSAGHVERLALQLLGSEQVCATWTPAQMICLTARLAHPNGEYLEHRRALARMVARRFQSPAEVQQDKLENWQRLAYHVGADAFAKEPEAATAWSAGLRKAYVEDANPGALSFADMAELSAAIRTLGEQDKPAFVAEWAEHTPALKDLTPVQSLWLAGELAAAGEAGRPARTRLARHVRENVLSDSVSAQKLGIEAACQVFSLVAGDLSEADRGAWTEAIQKAFVPSGGSVGGLSAAQVRALISALSQTGQSALADQMAIQAATKADSLASWSVADLLWLNSVLGGLGDRGMEARRKLAAHAAGAYFASPQKTRGLTAQDWSYLVMGLSKDMPDETRALWSKKLRGAFGTSPDTLGRLPAQEVFSYLTALRCLGGSEEPAPEAMLVAFLTKSAAWKKWSLSELAQVTVWFGFQGEPTHAARAAVAEHLLSGPLKDEKATKAISSDLLASLTNGLAIHLPAERRREWVGALKDLWAADAKAVSGLKPAEAQRFLSLVGSLDEAEGARLATQVVLETEGWRQWPAQETVSLARTLPKSEGDGQRARRRLAERVTERFASQPQAGEAVNASQWQELAGGLSESLTAESRKAWTAAMEAARKRAVEAGGEIAPGPIDQLQLVVAKLQGPDAAAAFISDFVVKNDQWQQWDAIQLLWLASKLAYEKSGKPGRERLIEHLDKTLIPNASVDGRQWFQFVDCLWPELSGQHDRRKAWALRLRKAHAETAKQVRELDTEKYAALNEVLAKLNRDVAAELADVRAADTRPLATASAADLAADAAAMSQTNPKAAGPVLAALERLAQRRDANIGWKTCTSVARTYGRLENEARCRVWAMAAYKALVSNPQARSAATENDLLELARFFREVDLNGKGKSYPEFAEAVASLGREGKLPASDKNWHDACSLGWLLGVPATRQTVQKELADKTGGVRPPVAKVLTWAYMTVGDGKLWDACLDAELARPAVQGEQRVDWLLARAYAAAAYGEPSPLLGRKWFDEALALTTRQDVKLEIVRQIAMGFGVTMRHKDGLAYLDAAAKEMPDQKTELAAFSAEVRVDWQKLLKRQAEAMQRRSGQLKAQAEEAGKQGNASLSEYYNRYARQCESQAVSLTAQIKQVEGNVSPRE